MTEFYPIDVLSSSYIIHIDNLIVTSDNGKILKSVYDYEGIRCNSCDIKGTNKCKVLIRNNSYVTPCELLDEIGVFRLQYVGDMSLILSSKIKVSKVHLRLFDKLNNTYERLVSLLDEVNGYVENNSEK